MHERVKYACKVARFMVRYAAWSAARRCRRRVDDTQNKYAHCLSRLLSRLVKIGQPLAVLYLIYIFDFVDTTSFISYIILSLKFLRVSFVISRRNTETTFNIFFYIIST